MTPQELMSQRIYVAALLQQLAQQQRADALRVRELQAAA